MSIENFTATPRKTSMVTKKRVASRLHLAKDYLETGNEYRQTIISSDGTKIKLFCHNAARNVWRTKATAYDR